MVGECKFPGCDWKSEAGLHPTHEAISQALFDHIMQNHAGIQEQDTAATAAAAAAQAEPKYAVRKCEVEGCEYSVPACEDFNTQTEALKLHWKIKHSKKTEYSSRVDQKIDRPVFPSVASDVEWVILNASWKRYCVSTKLDNLSLVHQLWSSLAKETAESLVHGGLQDEMNHEVLLAAVKDLIVGKRNPLFQRVELANMCQREGEQVKAFAARLRGKASLCELIKKGESFCENCENPVTATVSFMDEFIHTQLLNGLRSADWRERMFQKGAKMTLRSTLEALEALEAGKMEAGRLQKVGSVNAIKPQQKTPFKKFQGTGKKPVSGTQSPTQPGAKTGGCKNCGSSDHGSSPDDRKKNCPAFRV